MFARDAPGDPSAPPDEFARAATDGYVSRAAASARLEDWFDGDVQFLLLTGIPGSGKSVLAARVCLASSGEVAGPAVPHESVAFAWFCRADDPGSTSPQRFLEALSGRLTSCIDGYSDALVDSVEPLLADRVQIRGRAVVGDAASSAIVGARAGTVRAGDRPVVIIGSAEVGSGDAQAIGVVIGELRVDRTDSDVLDLTIRKPLESLASLGRLGTFVLLIDALDESLVHKGAESIASLLVDLDLPRQVRLVVTARPDPRVLDVLPRDTEVVDLAAAAEARHGSPSIRDADRDIARYLEQRFRSSATSESRVLLLSMVESIVRAADGAFLYAAYVATDLLSRPASSFATGPELPEGLAGLYRTWLRRELARPGEMNAVERWQYRYRLVLGLLAIAYTPGLRPSQIRKISGLSRSVIDDVLAAIAQYLRGDGDAPRRIWHESFREYLVSEGPHCVYPLERHADIADHLIVRHHGQWETGDEYAVAHVADHVLALLEVPEREPGSDDLAHSLWADLSFVEIAVGRLGVDHVIEVSSRTGRAMPGSLVARLAALLRPQRVRLRERAGQAVTGRVTSLLEYEAMARSDAELVELATARLRSLPPPQVSWRWTTRQVDALLETLEFKQLGAVFAPWSVVAMTPDGLRAASSAGDLTIRVWDLVGMRPVHRPLAGHSDRITCLALTPDGRRVASGSEDATVRIWDLEGGCQVGGPLRGEGSITAVAITTDGTRVVAGSNIGKVYVWHLGDDPQLVLERRIYRREVTAVAITPDGRTVVSAGAHEDIQLLDVATGDLIGQPIFDLVSAGALLVSADGGRLLAGGRDGGLGVWELRTAELVAHFDHGRAVSALAVSQDNTTIVSGSIRDGTVRVWDVATGTQVSGSRARDTEPVEDIGAMAVTSDGRLAVTVNLDALRVWDATTTPRVGSVSRGHSGPVWCVSLAPDARRALSGGRDGTVIAWDAATGRMQDREFRAHQGGVLGVAVSADSERGQSVGRRTWRTWSLADTRDVTEQDVTSLWRGNLWSWGGLSIAADAGRLVGASGESGRVEMWDLAGLSPVETGGPERAAGVWSVATTPNGDAFLAAGDDGKILVWDVGLGAPRADPITVEAARSEDVGSVALTDDGELGVYGTWDGRVRIWNLRTSALLVDVQTGVHITSTACAHNSSGRLTILVGELGGSVSCFDVSLPHVDPVTRPAAGS